MHEWEGFAGCYILFVQSIRIHWDNDGSKWMANDNHWTFVHIFVFHRSDWEYKYFDTVFFCAFEEIQNENKWEKQTHINIEANLKESRAWDVRVKREKKKSEKNDETLFE